MSTTGHYTRYINEYNQKSGKKDWSDNCDTMYHPVYDGENRLGYFQVEHSAGNKWSYCSFDNDGSLSDKYGYHVRKIIIEKSQRMAIQAVLESVKDIKELDLTDLIWDQLNFYKFAYLDYIARVETIDPMRSGWNRTECLNDWLDCDVCHCVKSDQPFTCRYMAETKGGMFEDKHPVCKYFQEFIGSVMVNV